MKAAVTGGLFLSMRAGSRGQPAVGLCYRPPPSVSGRLRRLRSEVEAAAQLAEQVLRVDAELVQQAGVSFGVDLVGQFLFGLLRLVAGGVLADELENLVFGDLHGNLTSLGVGDACLTTARLSVRGP